MLEFLDKIIGSLKGLGTYLHPKNIEPKKKTEFFLPTPQVELINRMIEAVVQVARRVEYKYTLVNKFIQDFTPEKAEKQFDDLTETFAKSIFKKFLNFAQILVPDEATADEMADIIQKLDLAKYDTLADKFALYSGPPGGGKGAVAEVFYAKYAGIVLKAKFVDLKFKIGGEALIAQLIRKGIAKEAEGSTSELKIKPNYDLKRNEIQGLSDEEFVKLKDLLKKTRANFIGKLVLIHSRSIRSGEQMGVNYHFRNEGPINELIAEGKIIWTLVNAQLQGMALDSFIDKYEFIDPKSGESYSGTAKVMGLNEVAKGNKIYILECGLPWFELLRDRFQKINKELLSFFISPFTENELKDGSYDTCKVLDSLLGLESGLREHNKECEVAAYHSQINAEREKAGHPIQDGYRPLNGREFESIVNEEAPNTMARRGDFRTVIVNAWGTTAKDKKAAIDRATEEFASAIFGNILKAIGVVVPSGYKAQDMAKLLRGIDLSKHDTKAKFVVYSGPRGVGVDTVVDKFLTLYGNGDLAEKFVGNISDLECCFQWGENNDSGMRVAIV